MRQGSGRLLVIAALAIAGAAAGRAQEAVAPPADPSARVDAIFARWRTPETPGCAVSVVRGGQTVLERGYGMANLEHAVPITPETVFEAGSVSKQFTATAVGLLAQEGRLSLDDEARKYVPELPDFGTPIRLRHLLHHTSGLRSQWPLLTLAGRPPGQAVHTTAEILDLVSSQRRLNFTPGAEYLYNNTGYTLLGVIVSRVSGQSFAAFSTERLFAPLGMIRTQWRDDHTRLVRGRAMAYTQAPDGMFHIAMPFTDVHGNGGLLTTVGDLQRWNANLDHPTAGWRALVGQLQTRGRLNDGFEIGYAQGLRVGTYRDVREVSHGGATAGYRAFLARFPDQRLSIAVLCNVTTVDAERVVHQVADVFLEGLAPAAPAAVPAPVSSAQASLRTHAGLYRDPATDGIVRLVWEKDQLRYGQAAGEPLVPARQGTFRLGDGGVEVAFEPDGTGTPARLVVHGADNPPRVYVRVAEAAPAVEQLAEYAGAYVSDELDVTYSVFVRAGRLLVRLRWRDPVALRPAYADAFENPEGHIVRFTRDGTGRVDGFNVNTGRVRHLRFERR